MSKPYKIGHDFENRIIEKLEMAGAVVIHAAQSKFPDGEACLNGKHFYFECKYNRYYNPIPLTKVDYQRALKIIGDTKTPLFMVTKQRHKNVISVVAVGGLGVLDSIVIRSILNRRGEKSERKQKD